MFDIRVECMGVGETERGGEKRNREEKKWSVEFEGVCFSF